MGWILISLVSIALVGSVFAAVHHAEIVAHWVGEPFGTLILSTSVTVIEVALIVSIMLSAKRANSELARDTVFATVMIVCNGVIGLCLLIGSIRHHTLAFRVEGTSAALSVLIALTTLALVLPAVTTTTPGPSFSTSQLAFAGVASIVLYGVFLFVQTIRHRDDFLPVGSNAGDRRASSPSTRKALASLAVLLVALVAVVVLAKMLSPSIEAAVAAAAAPPSVVGTAISLLVLLPETSAAVKAAAQNRMQTSLNLALGSALATIGLTIPAVAAVAILAALPLALGLPAKDIVLLALTLMITVVTMASGRATVLHGAVHLVLFTVFLFLSVVP